MKTFFERLVAERKRLRLRANAVAQAIGISRVTQSLYEHGKRTPDVTYLEQLWELGFDVHFLVTGDRKLPIFSAEEQALILLWRNATGPGKAAALAALQAGGEKSRRHLVQGGIHTEAGGQTVIAGGDIKGNFSV